MTLDADNVIKLLFDQGPIQRFTQDSPVMPDVWMAFAKDPDTQQDLLLTPYQPGGHVGKSPGELSRLLRERLRDGATSRAPGFLHTSEKPYQIAYNESETVVRLYFDELVRIVLPISYWWHQRIRGPRLTDTLSSLDSPQIAGNLVETLAREGRMQPAPTNLELGQDVVWMLRVVGTIALLNRARRFARESEHDREMQKAWPPAADANTDAYRDYYGRLLNAIAEVFRGGTLDPEGQRSVHLVNLNRSAGVSVWKSSVAVKADAARNLFTLRCNDLAWGIIDSGVDATHAAFQCSKPEPGKPVAATSRVARTFDFTIIRALLSGEAAGWKTLPARLQKRLAADFRLREMLEHVAQHVAEGRDLDWKLLMPLIQIPHTVDDYDRPMFEHGTHVAGILAADWPLADKGGELPEKLQGMCPDIRLYDLRVLDDAGNGAEFDVLAALQFVRYLNSQQSLMVIQGVNISLSIPHQVMNYACGRTPVCDECDRLVQSGVVVVAAAGNRGHVAARPPYVDEAYRSISITDPGNGDRVITVGATHRDMPHTYGVSYFSSRGPTGDGRVKPDLVAPGEKIESCVPGADGPRRLDGTSMAAPHVSGAAALLMARHRELIGQPGRIKEILCETATDLKRERYFQGHGMLDVLRALQKV